MAEERVEQPPSAVLEQLLFAAMICAGCVVLLMLAAYFYYFVVIALKRRHRRALRARAALARHEAASATRLDAVRAAYQAWEYVRKAHALTCTRCGELACPIPATHNRYACPACRNQFAGAPHPLPLPPPNPDAR
jgi:hypothetical protein